MPPKPSQMCEVPHCDKWRLSGPGRLCSAHRGGYRCQSVDCITRAVSGGQRPYAFCYRHNGGAACSVHGCTTAAKARGMCGKHGNKLCSHSGCTTAIQADGSGLCNLHGGGYRCVIPGCTTNAYRNIQCRRHKLVSAQADPGPLHSCQSMTPRAVFSDTPRPPQHLTAPSQGPGCSPMSKSGGIRKRHNSSPASNQGAQQQHGPTVCAFAMAEEDVSCQAAPRAHFVVGDATST